LALPQKTRDQLFCPEEADEDPLEIGTAEDDGVLEGDHVSWQAEMW
jgi:hypothetical protein